MSQLILPLPESSFWKKWLVRVLVAFIVLYVVYVVREIWLPLGLAFLLATVLDPVVDRMESRGWRRAPATCFIFFSFILLVTGLVALAIPHVVDQLETVQQSFSRYFPDTSQAGLKASLAKLRVPATLAGVAIQGFTGLQHGILRSSTWLTDYGMNFVSNLIWVVIVPLVAFYALRDYHILLGKALLLAPKKHRDSVQLYVGEISAVFARYLRGLAIVSLLNGLATWVLLAALHVPSALLLGIVAGVLYSVPYIGALMTVAFTAAVAFVGGGVSMLVWAVGLSMVLHQLLFDQIITPRILGGHVGIHPIVSIVALLVGNLLFGIVGMILAVPIAACVQIGVLAVVPKLKATIDLAPDFDHGSTTQENSATLQVISDETKAEHIQMDSHETIHGSVVQAVDQLEAQLQADQDAAPAT
jgi:predicted PurR-regulated permease PerM